MEHDPSWTHRSIPLLHTLDRDDANEKNDELSEYAETCIKRNRPQD